MVSDVWVRGSGWSAAMLARMASNGLGDANLGFEIPTGSPQLTPLPWLGINRISIRFTEDVSVVSGNLQLLGSNVASYGINAAGFSYDKGTFTATWALTGTVDK